MSRIVFRLIGLLLVLGLVLGSGVMVYKAGFTQGVSQAPAVAKAIEKSAESGQGAPIPPMMYGYGNGYGYYPHMIGHHYFGFFPFGAVCGSIFFLFLFLGLMRMVFFRGMWHRGWEGHKHGSWGKDWEGGLPSMFNEWHKRAHEVPVGGDEKPAEEGDKKG